LIGDDEEAAVRRCGRRGEPQDAGRSAERKRMQHIDEGTLPSDRPEKVKTINSGGAGRFTAQTGFSEA
jgi:hypothetical protein